MGNTSEFPNETNNETLQDDHMTLSSASLEYIKESANWTQFLSVIGFIIVGLMAFGSIGIFFLLNEIPNELGAIPFAPSLISLIYILVAILYLFPIIYLFKFSRNIKSAIKMNDNVALEEGFKNLKSHYKFVGILTIIVIGFYALGILAALVFSASF